MLFDATFKIENIHKLARIDPSSVFPVLLGFGLQFAIVGVGVGLQSQGRCFRVLLDGNQSVIVIITIGFNGNHLIFFGVRMLIHRFLSRFPIVKILVGPVTPERICFVEIIIVIVEELFLFKPAVCIVCNPNSVGVCYPILVSIMVVKIPSIRRLIS